MTAKEAIEELMQWLSGYAEGEFDTKTLKRLTNTQQYGNNFVRTMA